jgi:hypothetical protein
VCGRPFPLLALVIVLASPFGALPSAAAAECRVVEDFTKAKVGEFPPDWKGRQDGGWGAMAGPPT